MDMSVFVTNMASMIGIGVAVDYSLFVLARYREEIGAGLAPAEARSRAMATSGLAVVFSGLTVIVSLAGLWMIDNNAIRSMALGAILVVAVSLLASATLLPALIAVLGQRAYAPSTRFIALGVLDRAAAAVAAEPASRSGTRWTARVMRRPVVSLLARLGGAADAGGAGAVAEDGDGRAAPVPGGQRDAGRDRGRGVGLGAGRDGAGPGRSTSSPERAPLGA